MTSRERGRSGSFELSHDFVGYDLEPDKGGRSIAGAERHVGGVAVTLGELREGMPEALAAVLKHIEANVRRD
jgi:hypothetical protein